MIFLLVTLDVCRPTLVANLSEYLLFFFVIFW